MGCLFLYIIRYKRWCGFYGYTMVRFAAMDYGFQVMGIYMSHDCPGSLPPNHTDMRLQSYVFYSRTASGRGNLLSKKSSICGKRAVSCGLLACPTPLAISVSALSTRQKLLRGFSDALFIIISAPWYENADFARKRCRLLPKMGRKTAFSCAKCDG